MAVGERGNPSNVSHGVLLTHASMSAYTFGSSLFGWSCRVAESALQSSCVSLCKLRFLRNRGPLWARGLARTTMKVMLAHWFVPCAEVIWSSAGYGRVAPSYCPTLVGAPSAHAAVAMLNTERNKSL